MAVEYNEDIAFSNAACVDDFLYAVKLIDEKTAHQLEEDLNHCFFTNIESDIDIVDDGHYDIAYLMESHKIVRDAYLRLFEDGTANIISRLLNKCGSLSYFAELLDRYVSGLYWRPTTQPLSNINAQFLTMICDDTEYYAEFKAITIGLFNIIPLVYPGNDPESMLFFKIDIRPLSIHSELEGLKLIFRFKCDHKHYNSECNIALEIELTSLRRGVVVQAVQCLNNVEQYNKTNKYCQFIKLTGPEYDVQFVLKNLSLIKEGQTS
jgi:hypothetical protein